MEFIDLIDLFGYRQRIDNYYVKNYNGCYINISYHPNSFFNLHLNTTTSSEKYKIYDGSNIYRNKIMYTRIIDKLKIDQYIEIDANDYGEVFSFSISCDNLNILYNFLMLFDVECGRNIKIENLGL